MSFDGIRVNHAALDQAAADMQQGVKDIQDRLDRLEADLKPLQSDWIGSQQTAYHAAKAKWDTAIQEMNMLLKETHLAVTQSREDYQRADSNGAARFQ